MHETHSSPYRSLFGSPSNFRKSPKQKKLRKPRRSIGRGQNTGLGWSDPTFAHVSVPKVIRGVAPAQLRGDRAECFVRAAFRNRGPQ